MLKEKAKSTGPDIQTGKFLDVASSPMDESLRILVMCSCMQVSDSIFTGSIHHRPPIQ